jgi:hypothetical protein
MYLTHTDVATVAAGSDAYHSLGTMLETAYANNPNIKPVIHLGWTSAMSLQLGLASLDLPFVVAHGYPATAMAVTGPVVIRLGSIQSITGFDAHINRQYFEATRIAAIEFDPSQAVRVS